MGVTARNTSMPVEVRGAVLIDGKQKKGYYYEIDGLNLVLISSEGDKFLMPVFLYEFAHDPEKGLLTATPSRVIEDTFSTEVDDGILKLVPVEIPVRDATTVRTVLFIRDYIDEICGQPSERNSFEFEELDDLLRKEFPNYVTFIYSLYRDYALRQRKEGFPSIERVLEMTNSLHSLSRLEEFYREYPSFTTGFLFALYKKKEQIPRLVVKDVSKKFLQNFTLGVLKGRSVDNIFLVGSAALDTVMMVEDFPLRNAVLMDMKLSDVRVAAGLLAQMSKERCSIVFEKCKLTKGFLRALNSGLSTVKEALRGMSFVSCNIPKSFPSDLPLDGLTPSEHPIDFCLVESGLKEKALISYLTGSLSKLRLGTLDLSRNQMTESLVNAILRLNFEKIVLKDTKITEKMAEMIMSFLAGREGAPAKFDISFNPLGLAFPRLLDKLFASRKNLHYVNAAGMGLGLDGTIMLLSVLSGHAIKYLNLSYNFRGKSKVSASDLDEFSGAFGEFLRNTPTLKTLKIKGYDSGTTIKEIKSNVFRKDKLHMSLSSSTLTRKSIKRKKIKKEGANPLTHPSLDFRLDRAVGERVAEAVTTSQSLQKLDLSNNDLGDRFLYKILSTLLYSRTLRKVKLHGNAPGPMAFMNFILVRDLRRQDDFVLVFEEDYERVKKRMEAYAKTNGKVLKALERIKSRYIRVGE